MAETLLRIPVSGLEYPELHRRVSQLFARQEARLEEVEGRQTTSFLGLYDQVADETGDGILTRASDYNPGDTFQLSTTGVFTTSLPELSGQSGGPVDRIIAGPDGLWLLDQASTDYLSSVADDEAEGVITFALVPISVNLPASDPELANKRYVDQQDSAHVSASDPHPQYLQAVDLADFARLSISNVFSSGGREGQIIQSDDINGRPGIRLYDSQGRLVSEYYYNEEATDNRVNIIAYPDADTGDQRMLFLQNGIKSNDQLGSVGIGDHRVIEQYNRGPGVLVVEEDVWIKDEVSLSQIGDDIRNGRYARTDRANVFTAYPQKIQSQSPTGRPALQLRNAADEVVSEYWYNEDAADDRVNILTYTTSTAHPLYLQNQLVTGNGAGVVVGDDATTPDHGPGTLTAEKQLMISGATTRPSVQIRDAADAVVWEAYHNTSTDVVGMLAYSGRTYQIQPGASGGVTVRDPTYTPAQGELSVEGDIRSGGSVYADSTEELIRESDALAVFTYAAYGGLSLGTPGVGAPIGATWETVQFDTLSPLLPRHVTANTTINTIAYHADGVYALTVSINVVHNSAQGGRNFELRLWNVTEAAQIGNIIVVTTGRNADGSHMSITSLVEIGEAQKNHPIRLEVGNTLDTYTGVLWDVAEMATWSVGEYREPLPSDAP